MHVRIYVSILLISILFGKNDIFSQDTLSSEEVYLDRANDHALKQLCVIDVILEELAQFINNDFIKVTNKYDVIESIADIRAVVEPYKYDQLSINIQSIYKLLSFNKLLMQHIKTLLKNNFTDIPIIDLSMLLNISSDNAIEELEQFYDANEMLLESLREDSSNAGLTWYNHLARKISSFCHFGSMANRAVGFTMGLVTASLILHQVHWLPERILDWQIPCTSKKLFGRLPVVDVETGVSTVVQEKDRGLIGEFVRFAPQIVTNPALVIPAGLTGYYLADDVQVLSEWCIDRVASASDFLLGRKHIHNRTTRTRIEPRCTFEDVIGQQEIKDTLSKIVRYIEDPPSIDNRGLKLERGYLFTGKTRSGKSFMAEALAGEIKAALERTGKDGDDFNFFVLSADSLREPGNFRESLQDARMYEPCILFIDEIHLLDLQMGKSNSLLSEFLTELSGCLKNNTQSKVFVIAATNREDSLDKTLRQSGRLGKEIRFEYPTFQDRKTFIIDMLKKRAVNSDMLDIDTFARETEDCTFEDLITIIQDAFIMAKFNLETLSQKHFYQSFDKNIRNIIVNDGRELSVDQQRLIALHQAGYVLATKLLIPHQSIAKVTILPIRERIRERSVSDQYNTAQDTTDDRVTYGKLFTYAANNNETLNTMREQIGACCVALAGYATGNVMLGKEKNSIAYLAAKRQEAFDSAKKIVTHGMSIDSFDDSLKAEYCKRALTFCNACEKKITELIEDNKETVALLANALLEHGSLTGTEIDALLAHHMRLISDRNNVLDVLIDCVLPH